MKIGNKKYNGIDQNMGGFAKAIEVWLIHFWKDFCWLLMNYKSEEEEE